MCDSFGTITWSLFLLLAPGWAESQACSYSCQCPSQPLECSVGTSHVWDACRCCKVCARQLGELCSLQKPCDHHKGLYCDFSKIHRDSGICLAQEGATCDLLGKIYHNGESFQPTCKLQCICMDGAIGCIPLCSSDLRLPSPDCPNPRRVQLRNQCCEEWICEGGSQENHFEMAMAGEQSNQISLLIGFLCVKNATWPDYSAYSYFEIVTMCDFIMILIFYFIYVFRVYRVLTCISWPLAELLHYFVATILLLIASIMAASKSYSSRGLVAGATFGFLATFLCTLSIWLSYKVSCVTQSTDAAV